MSSENTDAMLADISSISHGLVSRAIGEIGEEVDIRPLSVLTQP